jgi:vanillate O-demethylase monooxygenase subunit
MYPLGADRPWPVNQWYVAGFSSEIDRVIRPRTFLGRRVVMFRDEEGKVQAVSGVCPHRMMPMEEGRLEGDQLACGYHGLTYDVHTGQCVKSPNSLTLPRCSLVKYPAKEIGPLVWIWVGDPKRAETTEVPPQASIGIGLDGWATQCVDYKMLKARYILLLDNLFDLSHIYYVHRSILGDSGRMTLLDPRVEHRDGRLVVYREVMDVPIDDFDRLNYPEVGERVSKRNETELLGVSIVNAGTRAVEGPSWDAENLRCLNFIHLLTPETETTTHYWAMLTRDFRIDDDAYDRQLAELEVAVIAQDREALEKIEAMLQSTADLPREISMRPDVGALQARKLIVDMIEND